MNNIICIAGPTASGKTALAVELAKELNGEVISCDSMQIYKRMDIGTAKPTAEEMQGIVHHMIDVAEPEEDFSVAGMAKIVRLGESAFKQRFRAEMGVSPRTWFNDRRARAAAEALLEPGATVAAVAERFGFGNEFYFSRFFRRHHGLSPSQWRRQCHV